MKKRLKWILSLTLCVFMGMQSLPVSAKTLTEGLYEYTVEDGKATIVKYTAVNEYVNPGMGMTICIPKRLGGYPVVSIGSHAFSQDNIECVIIPDSVVSIQRGAFDECWILSNIVIPDSVERIEPAFSHTRITRLVIPASVIYLENLTFMGCHHLEKVYYMGDAPQIRQGSLPLDKFTSYYLAGTAGWDEIEWNGLAHEQKEQFYEKGDANHDGVKDLHDAQQVLKWALNLGVPDALQKLAADMDGDGMVSLKDA